MSAVILCIYGYAEHLWLYWVSGTMLSVCGFAECMWLCWVYVAMVNVCAFTECMCICWVNVAMLSVCVALPSVCAFVSVRGYAECVWLCWVYVAMLVHGFLHACGYDGHLWLYWVSVLGVCGYAWQTLVLTEIEPCLCTYIFTCANFAIYSIHMVYLQNISHHAACAQSCIQVHLHAIMCTSTCTIVLCTSQLPESIILSLCGLNH